MSGTPSTSKKREREAEKTDTEMAHDYTELLVKIEKEKNKLLELEVRRVAMEKEHPWLVHIKGQIEKSKKEKGKGAAPSESPPPKKKKVTGTSQQEKDFKRVWCELSSKVAAVKASGKKIPWDYLRKMAQINVLWSGSPGYDEGTFFYENGKMEAKVPEDAQKILEDLKKKA